MKMRAIVPRLLGARRTGSLLVVGAMLTAGGCADDGGGGGCVFPIGTYTVEASYVGGDCDSELVSRLLGTFPSDTEMYDFTCGTDSATNQQVDANGCDVTLTIDAERTANGVENSEMTVTRDCGFDVCTADFNLYWTQR